MIKFRKSFLFVIVINLCILLSGCEENHIPEYVQYNAKLYDDAIEWINADFIEETYNNYYNKGIAYFKITDEQKYNLIFKEKYEELNIDYKSQMILVICHSTYYKQKDYLYHLFIDGPTFYIYFVKEKRNPIKLTESIKRWKVISMDYLDISEENIMLSYANDV